MEFKEGEMYYRLLYPGVGLLYPTIQTFIYVGKNLSDLDEEDTWYFQFAEDYAEFGSILESNTGDRAVCLIRDNERSDMLDIDGLARQLKRSARLRGKPGQI